MKKYLLIPALMVMAFSLRAQELAKLDVTKVSIESEVLAPTFNWESKEHDFGKIKHAVPVTAKFEFENTGSAPLVIQSAKGSCGCTVADYTKTAIKPGEKGFIKATYNAASLGAFNKTVTVTANTEDGPVVLKIKGEVVNN
ncbi:DUF1573 domain-containing protein [Fulvivirgaceae bacterium BMA10]|uniref:DUF1573 domain-containing protein n=1 Tax=Splendidivirga corallicola TaxID=3051826 RepID=A0ABT8KMD9_9BACT|nr:DUF1573 domain-containing protein [Fulvivirgaceae bacterium BMA10]